MSDSDKGKEKKRNIIRTPIGRLSFPNLFEKRAYEGQEAKFSCVILFPPGTDLTELKAAVNEVARAKFPNGKPKKFRSPFRDAAEKDVDGYEDGWVFITCSSQIKPQIVGPKIKPITDPAVLYPGCWIRATVRPFAYDTKGNQGVSFGLNNVQKIKDGEPLGSFSKAEDDFDEVETVDDEDSDNGEDMFV